MAFPDSFIDELISRTDIVELVSQYVPMTRRGGNYFGLCPFHSEKTPSFSVSPDKQIFHCFGCGTGGGAINFIMQMESLDYPDAVRFLARRAGLEVMEDEHAGQRKIRERVLALNRAAARFFFDMLSDARGRTAAEYVARRGLSKSTVLHFGIGCAPGAWDSLIKAMSLKGYDKSDLLDAGLAVKNSSGGVYDRFRNRLMFPIINTGGDVIGFGGRVLDDSQPKYLNSPDTVAFNKSRNLFALNFAKKTKQGRLILAEGYMDVISLHQAGFDCAVASLGTSLTEAQARLMTRYTKEVVIAYDSDQAGIAAAQRAIGILNKTGVTVKVLRYTGAKDPDEYIKTRGREAFGLLIEGSENHAAYRLASIEAKYDLKIDEHRVEFVKEAAKLLSGLENPVEREIYGVNAAQAAGISKEAMALEIKRAYAKRRSKEKKDLQRRETNPVRMSQPVQRDIRYDDIVSAKAEEGLLTILLTNPEYIKKAGQSLFPEDFSVPFLGKLFGRLLERCEQDKSLSLAAMTQDFSQSELAHITRFIQQPVDNANVERAIDDQTQIIKKQRTKRLALDDDASLLSLAKEKRSKSS